MNRTLYVGTALSRPALVADVYLAFACGVVIGVVLALFI